MEEGPRDSIDTGIVTRVEDGEQNDTAAGEEDGELLAELQLEREKHDEQMKLEVRAREVIEECRITSG